MFAAWCSVDMIPQRTRHIFQLQFRLNKPQKKTNNVEKNWRVLFGVTFGAWCSVDMIPQRTRQIFQLQFGVNKPTEKPNNVEKMAGPFGGHFRCLVFGRWVSRTKGTTKSAVPTEGRGEAERQGTSSFATSVALKATVPLPLGCFRARSLIP